MSIYDNYIRHAVCGLEDSHEEAITFCADMMPKDKYGGWIPISDRMPEDRDWYLGIFKEPDTGWINPLPFICDYVGSKTKATTKEYWILRGFTDRDEHIDYYFNLECVAWMPLPKPYEPQERRDGNITKEEINHIKYKVCCPMRDNEKCVKGADKCEAEIWAKSKVKKEGLE